MIKQLLLLSFFLYTIVNLSADVNKEHNQNISSTPQRLFHLSRYQPFYTRTSTGVVIPVAEMQRDLEREKSDREIILFLAQLHLKKYKQ